MSAHNRLAQRFETLLNESQTVNTTLRTKLAHKTNVLDEAESRISHLNAALAGFKARLETTSKQASKITSKLERDLETAQRQLALTERYLIGHKAELSDRRKEIEWLKEKAKNDAAVISGQGNALRSSLRIAESKHNFDQESLAEQLASAEKERDAYRRALKIQAEQFSVKENAHAFDEMTYLRTIAEHDEVEKGLRQRLALLGISALGNASQQTSASQSNVESCSSRSDTEREPMTPVSTRTRRPQHSSIVDDASLEDSVNAVYEENARKMRAKRTRERECSAEREAIESAPSVPVTKRMRWDEPDTLDVMDVEDCEKRQPPTPETAARGH